MHATISLEHVRIVIVQYSYLTQRALTSCTETGGKNLKYCISKNNKTSVLKIKLLEDTFKKLSLVGHFLILCANINRKLECFKFYESSISALHKGKTKKKK